MLSGSWVPEDHHQINYTKLPRVPSQHAVVNSVRQQKGVNQCNYLIQHDGRYFLMWSDGPGVEDRVGQRVKFATSVNGLKWREPKFLSPVLPHSAPDSPLYNTRTDKGFRDIARGFWQHANELLASMRCSCKLAQREAYQSNRRMAHGHCPMLKAIVRPTPPVL